MTSSQSFFPSLSSLSFPSVHFLSLLPLSPSITHTRMHTHTHVRTHAHTHTHTHTHTHGLYYALRLFLSPLLVGILIGMRHSVPTSPQRLPNFSPKPHPA